MFAGATVILRTLSIIDLKSFWITVYRTKKKWLLCLRNLCFLRKSLKGILICCKLRILLKSENKLAKTFRFKDSILKEVTSGVVYKF